MNLLHAIQFSNPRLVACIEGAARPRNGQLTDTQLQNILCKYINTNNSSPLMKHAEAMKIISMILIMRLKQLYQEAVPLIIHIPFSFTVGQI